MFNDEVIIKSQQRFRSYHHKVYTEEVNKIALSSNDDKRIQTFDKVTTFPHGANVFKVCEGEMLSKNKLIGIDDDKNMLKDNDNDEDKTTIKTIAKIEDKDKTTIKATVKIEDNTTATTNTNTEDKNMAKSKTKAKSEDIDEEIQMFPCSKTWNDEEDNWKIRRIVLVFRNNGHVSELCEKWIYRDGNHAIKRFEELRTSSGEVIFTREHKVTLSKDTSNTYINIDDLKIFKDFSTSDKTILKSKTVTILNTMTRTKNKDRIDKVINKI